MAKKQQHEKEEKIGKKRKFEEVQEIEEESSEFEEPPPGFVGENESESEEEESQEKKQGQEPRRDRFREYYMSMVTEEFGDDLDVLRKDKSFHPKRSLPILIRALEQGINIFSEEERKLILEQS